MEKLEGMLEMGNSGNAIVDMARTVGFQNADEANVEELFQSHMEELSNESLLVLEIELNYEDYATSAGKPVKRPSTKQLITFFKHNDTTIGITDDTDINKGRCAKVTQAIDSSVACYKELYSERQKAALQQSLHHFFRGAESCQSTGSARQLVQPDHAPHSPASSDSSD
jgi:hypothetical protein